MYGNMFSRSRSKYPALKQQGYTEVKQLGKGSFGFALLVRRDREPCKDELFVAKMIKYRHLGAEGKELIVREIRGMRTITEAGGHPHLVQMLCIIMDYCDSGDLAQRIAKQRLEGQFFQEEQVKIWFVQLLTALDFLHFKGMMHRDIKPANIFMHKHDVTLGDLGLCKQDRRITCAQQHTQCGSPLYLAPEVHMGQAYSKSVDIWGLGCTLFEMMMLDNAFQGDDKEHILKNIVYAKHATIRGKWSSELKETLELMLNIEPKARPSTHELLKTDHVKDVLCYIHLDALKHRESHRLSNPL